MTEMTLEQWAELPEDVGGELVDGRLEEEEVPTLVHETVVSWLVGKLEAWAASSGAWVFGSEGKYAVGAKTGRKPDVVVYLASNPPRQPRGVVRTPPDVVVEVISERARDRTRDRIEKAKDYAAFRVSVYVLVDPDARSFEVFELDKKRWVLASAITRGVVTLRGCEGLALEIGELWARIDRLEKGAE